jgi:hypothetical protein
VDGPVEGIKKVEHCHSDYSQFREFFSTHLPLNQQLLPVTSIYVMKDLFSPQKKAMPAAKEM